MATTLSGFRQKDVLAALDDALLRSDGPRACYLAAEVVCSSSTVRRGGGTVLAAALADHVCRHRLTGSLPFLEFVAAACQRLSDAQPAACQRLSDAQSGERARDATARLVVECALRVCQARPKKDWTPTPVDLERMARVIVESGPLSRKLPQEVNETLRDLSGLGIHDELSALSLSVARRQDAPTALSLVGYLLKTKERVGDPTSEWADLMDVRKQLRSHVAFVLWRLAQSLASAQGQRARAYVDAALAVFKVGLTRPRLPQRCNLLCYAFRCLASGGIYSRAGTHPPDPQDEALLQRALENAPLLFDDVLSGRQEQNGEQSNPSNQSNQSNQSNPSNQSNQSNPNNQNNQQQHNGRQQQSQLTMSQTKLTLLRRMRGPPPRLDFRDSLSAPTLPDLPSAEQPRAAPSGPAELDQDQQTEVVRPVVGDVRRIVLS